MIPFEDFPLWLNLAAFTAGAMVIWLAGTRLSRYADTLAERTGVGKAFIGALLLGGITSLPEAATTVTASASGSAPLAVNNVFGGVAMQVAILAVADAVVPGRALSARIRKPSVLLQGALLILVLAVAAAGIALGDVAVFGVGAWTTAIFVVCVAAFYLIHDHRTHETWEPEDGPGDHGDGEDDSDGANEADEADERGEAEDAEERDTGDASHERDEEHRSTRRLVSYTALAALAILVAGFAIARSADALADQTGLGQSFVGMLFLAVATSLPEVTTTLAAARMGEFAMAFSNIFGANILDTAVLFLADVAYGGGPVLNEVGTFSLVAALLGLLVTAVYLVGLLERRGRVLVGMGKDSILVLVIYVAGIAILYTLR